MSTATTHKRGRPDDTREEEARKRRIAPAGEENADGEGCEAARAIDPAAKVFAFQPRYCRQPPTPCASDDYTDQLKIFKIPDPSIPGDSLPKDLPDFSISVTQRVERKYILDAYFDEWATLPFDDLRVLVGNSYAILESEAANRPKRRIDSGRGGEVLGDLLDRAAKCHDLQCTHGRKVQDLEFIIEDQWGRLEMYEWYLGDLERYRHDEATRSAGGGREL